MSEITQEFDGGNWGVWCLMERRLRCGEEEKREV
jgi:hypothetical protein